MFGHHRNQGRRHSRTSSSGSEMVSYTPVGRGDTILKVVQRDCINGRNMIASHVTWLRVLSVLFILYFCYKELLPSKTVASSSLMVTMPSATSFMQVESTNENVTSDIEELKKKVHYLEAHVKDLTGDLHTQTELFEKERKQSLESTESKFFDTSSVAATLLESALRWSSSRFVSCDWERCRQESFVGNAKHLISDYMSTAQDKSVKVVQVGYCVEDLANWTMQFSDKLLSFDLMDPFTAQSPAGNTSCGNKPNALRSADKLEEFYKKQAEWAKTASTTTKANVAVSKKIGHFNAKSLDVVILDHTNEASTHNLAASIRSWLKQLKVGGLLIGHSLASLRPFEVENGIDVAWLHETLSPAEATFTKETVSSLLQDGQNDLRVWLAGDTTWYIKKKKVKLSDLFRP